MTLQGTLNHFGVADVFQLIAQQRQTGVLGIEREGRTLEIFFLDGSVLRARPAESRPDGALGAFLLRTGIVSEPDLAEAWRQQEETLESLGQVLVSQGLTTKEAVEQMARLLSEEAIFELFLWDDGEFSFRAERVVEGEGDVLVGAEMVLLDALRMRDEWAQVQSVLPELTPLVVPTVDIEEFRQRRAAAESSSSSSADDLDRLFVLADGRLTARRVVDLARLGTFQGSRGLIVLIKEGLVRLEEPLPEEERRGGARRLAQGLGLGALILAGGLALAVVLLALPVPQLRGLPIPAAGLSDAREAAELERLRASLEAYRWAKGRYPERLEELGEMAGLAADSGDRYSYRRFEGGYRLSEH